MRVSRVLAPYYSVPPLRSRHHPQHRLGNQGYLAAYRRNAHVPATSAGRCHIPAPAELCKPMHRLARSFRTLHPQNSLHMAQVKYGPTPFTCYLPTQPEPGSQLHFCPIKTNPQVIQVRNHPMIGLRRLVLERYTTWFTTSTPRDTVRNPFGVI